MGISFPSFFDCWQKSQVIKPIWRGRRVQQFINPFFENHLKRNKSNFARTCLGEIISLPAKCGTTEFAIGCPDFSEPTRLMNFILFKRNSEKMFKIYKTAHQLLSNSTENFLFVTKIATLVFLQNSVGSRLRKAGRCRFYHGRTLSH